VLASNVLVRIDDVELKGFDGLRPIYTLVPGDDPGLADFQAARNACSASVLFRDGGRYRVSRSGCSETATLRGKAA
jgi:hypothetical protein